MTTTQTSTDRFATMTAELDALPELPASITARDMYHAQSVRLTAAERAAISARIAFDRRWGFPPQVTLPVFTPDGCRIGGMTYHR